LTGSANTPWLGQKLAGKVVQTWIYCQSSNLVPNPGIYQWGCFLPFFNLKSKIKNRLTVGIGIYLTNREVAKGAKEEKEDREEDP